MILLQWVQALGLGALVGIGIGYLTWKLPDHLDRFFAWRWERAGRRSERKIKVKPRIRAQVERIEGMFRMDTEVPLTEPELLPGERVLDFLERTWTALEGRWAQFLVDTAPRDPIQMVRSNQA